MKKIERPTGLITYETDDNVDRYAEGEKPRYRFIRPRTMVYAAAFSIVAVLMLGAFLTREELQLNAQRDRNPNYVQLSDGSVRNGYNLKIVNKAGEPRELELILEGADPTMQVRVLGAAADTPMRLPVGVDQTQDFILYLTLPADAIDSQREEFVFRVTDPVTGETATTRSVLVTGVNP